MSQKSELLHELAVTTFLQVSSFTTWVLKRLSSVGYNLQGCTKRHNDLTAGDIWQQEELLPCERDCVTADMGEDMDLTPEFLPAICSRSIQNARFEHLHNTESEARLINFVVYDMSYSRTPDGL